MAVANWEQQQRGEDEAAIAIMEGMASPIQSISVQLNPILAVYG